MSEILCGVPNASALDKRKKKLSAMVVFFLLMFLGIILCKKKLFYTTTCIFSSNIEQANALGYTYNGEKYEPTDDSAVIYFSNVGESKWNEINFVFNNPIQENAQFKFYYVLEDGSWSFIAQKDIRKGYDKVTIDLEKVKIPNIAITVTSIEDNHKICVPQGKISLNMNYVDIIKSNINYFITILIIASLSAVITIVIYKKQWEKNNNNTSNSVKRESNLELLRIICMFFLIAHHFTVHGGLLGLEFSSPKVVAILFLPVGKICFVAFIALSMYFLVDGTVKSSRFIKCWIEVLFYSVLLTIVTWLSGGVVTGKDLFSSFFVMIGNSHGFAASYLLFLAIYPFILKISKNCTKSQARYLLFITFWIQIVSQILFKFTGYNQPVYSELTLFIFCYFLSLNIKRYPIKKISNIVPCIIVVVSVYLFSFFINYYGSQGKISNNVSKVYNILADNESSILYIIGGYALFYIFNKIKIPKSSIINTISSCTFGILLIHDHNFFRKILWEDLVQTRKIYNSNRFIVYFIFAIFVVFISCWIIEYIRQILFERTMISSKPFSKISKKMDDMLK